MYLNKLQLWNFRSYENLELNFPKGITILYGDNGQGKTNIVEAIYLLCTGKSHRTNRETDMISNNSPWARIRCEDIQKDGKHTVDMVMARGQKKRILVNGLAISRISEILGQLSGVIFSPEDLDLVKEGPQKRRRFMDIELSQVSKSYFYALNEYNKVLEQRNSLLKEIKKESDLFVWDTLLAQRAVPIIKARRDFMRRLTPKAKEMHEYLSSGKEKLNCIYKEAVPEREDIEAAVMELLEKNHDTDMKRLFTTVGPHKDDIIIKLGDTDLRYFGSQGQQRTATLALKLTELEMMKEDLSEYPVLLLDDVLSELDTTRQKMLLDKIKDVQTIITVAQPVDYFNSMDVSFFKVEKGRVWKK
jgi:DNA replication and repair protein RecF